MMAESLFAQVRSPPGDALEDVMDERVCDAHSFGREPVLRWTCSSICICRWSSSAFLLLPCFLSSFFWLLFMASFGPFSEAGDDMAVSHF